MRRRLLELLQCPRCREAPLTLTPLSGDDQITEGVISCPRCHARFPVIAGVPRMLPAHLGCCLPALHPAFFNRYPKLRPAPCAHPADDPLARTLRGFSHQHVDMADRCPEMERWKDTFLSAVPVAPGFFPGKLGLDLGCGAGRHLTWAQRWGAEMVGVDLSDGVTVAHALGEGAHAIQADIYHLPLRPGAFDFAYSLGVLHHLPDPADGFRRLLATVRPGGDVFFWVYGLEDMRWSYRISHLRWLRSVTPRLSLPAQRAVCVGLAALLEAALWTPARVLEALPGGRPVARRIPLSDSAHRGFPTKVRNVFDRLNPPITHYHTADELRGWLRAAGLEQIEVLNRHGRGWIAAGHRGEIVPAPAANASAA